MGVIGLGPETAERRLLPALYSSGARGRFQDAVETEGFGVMIGLLR